MNDGAAGGQGKRAIRAARASRRGARRVNLRAALAGRALLGGCVGAVLAALLLWAFHAVAVVDAGAPWERAWLLAIHASCGPALTGAAGDISSLGYPVVIIPVFILAVAWFWLQGDGWRTVRLVAATGALTAVDYGCKRLFARPRPALFPHAFVAGASYPSGHALFAVGFYGAIAALLVAGARRGARIAVLAAWAALALALGLSRLVLGVHWPTDVIAGYAAGAAVWAAVWVAVPTGWRRAR